MVQSTSWMAIAITTFAGVVSATFTIPYSAPNPNAPARVEWETFIQDPIRKDLWYHTITECQRRRESTGDPGSYFSVSGIHGLPRLPWDGVDGSNSMHDGFCFHNDPIFGPWHRPYMRLYEETLAQCCNTVVNQMREAGNPNAERYNQERLRMKLPYWDWTKTGGLPTGCNTPTIDVTSIDGSSTINIPNPMYSYQFKGGSDVFGSGQTSRSSGADAALAANANTLRDAIADIFRTDRVGVGAVSYAQAVSYGQGGLNSIEDIHGWIHVWMGGYMSDIDAAGFDPLFMLHHCFIDLLIAAWEMLNPDQGFESYTNPYGSWAQPPNTVETLDTPLVPFRKQDGRYWTPRDCADHTTVGTTYDVFVGRTPQQVHSWIQSTYGDGGSVQAGGWEGGEDDQGSFKKREETPSYASTGASGSYGSDASPSTGGSGSYAAGSSPSAGSYGDNKTPSKEDNDDDKKKNHRKGQGHGGKYRGLRRAPDRATLYKHRSKLYRENDKKQHTWHQYHAHYNGSRQHIPCSYTMHAFLGEPTEKDPKKFTEDPAYVGSYPVFSKKGGMHMPSSGYVPITNAILNYAVSENKELEDTSPEHVQAFVKKNMQWRVEAVDGEDYNKPEILKHFNFGLLSNEVTDIGGKIVFGTVNPLIEDLEGILENATKDMPIVEGVFDVLKGATGGLGQVLGGAGASPVDANATNNNQQSSGAAGPGPDSQRGLPGTKSSAGETPAGKVALPFKG